ARATHLSAGVFIFHRTLFAATGAGQRNGHEKTSREAGCAVRRRGALPGAGRLVKSSLPFGADQENREIRWVFRHHETRSAKFAPDRQTATLAELEPLCSEPA